MIAYEVSVNGERRCLAGVGARGVLSAILHWVNHEGSESNLRVGGLRSDLAEHVTWLAQGLKVGDQVSVRVLEAEQVDSPTDSRPRDSDDQLRCSFCNLPRADVKKLIQGPVAAICDQCVEVCVQELKAAS